MRCASCLAENPEGARFCARCGVLLPAGQDASPGRGDVASEGLRAADRATANGGLERRSVTILFCDLVGSTAMSRRLDPEELGEVLLAYRESCTEIVGRYGGYVARYVGDSLLVYFGYPQAHDDDALRAVRAALQVNVEMERLSARYGARAGAPLMVHMGIHTGEVIAGDFGSGALREQAAVVGETPNVAARLQSVAGAGEIVISDATHRLIRDRFRCDRLPDVALKGIDVAMTVYRVIGEETLAADDATWVSTTGSDPVGREEELGLLVKRWRRVQEGDGQVVLVSGEPGIGKTLLLQTLTSRIASEAGAILVAHCSPYFSNTAFFPVLDLLRRQLGLGTRAAIADIRSALEAAHGVREPPQPDTLALVVSMLAGMSAKDAVAPDRTPQAQRDRFMEWLLQWLIDSGHPLILAFEDLHWSDASTLDFLKLLLDQAPSRAVFVLLTFRAEFRPPWPIRSHVTHLTLGRLSSGDVRALVLRLTEGKPLPASMLEQVIKKTDGVPLFVEEFTKMVVEAGALETAPAAGGASGATRPAINVPDSLRGSLIARLDRHSDARSLAQIAAVIDREIAYRLLRVVSGLDDDILRKRLSALVDAELLLQRGIPPEATYTFKHALIRDAAYQSLLKTSRATYHRLTAEALLAQFPALSESHPEFVAHHFSEAGLGVKAFGYWRTAGMRALEASANAEAAAHLQRALGELAALPLTSIRAGQEVELQIALGTALTAARGYGSNEVELAYARAYSLCENLGDVQQLFVALTGLHTFYQVRGPIRTACKVAERLVDLAERSRDEPQLAQAHRRMGWSLFCVGQMRPGKEHLDRALDLYDHTRSTQHSIVYGAHPWIVGFVNSAWLEWVAGNPAEAQRRSEQALLLARELGRPLPLAYALCMSAAMYQCQGDPQETLDLAAETVALARDNSMPYWVAWGTVLEGWALTRLGSIDTGMSSLHSGLKAYRETGAELFRPYSLSLLAEACRAAGRIDEAAGHLDLALESAKEQDVHFYSAEIHRLRGETILESGGDVASAVDQFNQAMALANTQGALAFELRAGVSLAELLVRSGDAARGHALARELLARRPGVPDSPELRRAVLLAANVS
ncbi:MAG: adenylate/guanylate cyclase domain-containing protein [Burkholderiales bacterium]